MHKRGKLFFKFLFVLLVVSLGPLAFVGYYILNQSKVVIKQAVLSDQRTMAVGLADTARNYVSAFHSVINDAARLPEFQTQDAQRQKEALGRLLQTNASLIEMSLLDARGMETVRADRSNQQEELHNYAEDPIFLKAVHNGEYVGSLDHYKGLYPTIRISAQIVNSSTGRMSGVLVGRLNLSGLSSILKTAFPASSQAETEAAVVSHDGFMVADSNIDKAFKADAKLPKEVTDILFNSAENEGSGEIQMQDGSRVLGSFAYESSLDWIVYVQQPVTMVENASNQLMSSAGKAMLYVIAFVLMFGYLISLVIVQPIQTLREAALKLSEGEFEDLPELKMPNDEIGDLAQTFSQMSDSLRIKTAEIVSARDELEKLNRSLESRVDARTRELKSAQDELIKKERLAAIGQMASVVGHEIRNPLAVINNSTYFIKTKLTNAGEIDPKIAKHIGIIESEIQQANGIINEILGFARTRELMLKPVNVNNYLEEILSSYPFPPHIEVMRQLSPENPWVNIDTEEMKQAVRNIIGNGIEVMPQSGAITVATSRTADGLVQIAISDAGPGIPQDVLEKIFAPFFTTKARGTGLGLAVVKKVIDRHKGKVEVESVVGKGTTFKLLLPAYTPPPQA